MASRVYRLSRKAALFMAAMMFGYVLYKRSKRYLTKKAIKRSKFQPRIVIIGAGLSGICMAIKLKHDLGYNNFIIYEMLDGLGGTWYANTYPGCCCDVAGHLYSFSFSPNPFAKRAYPSQPETLQYVNDVVDKYDVRKYIQFNTQVIGCEYNQSTSKWTLLIQNTKQSTNTKIEANLVISATGLLTIPNYPSFYNANDCKFKGQIVHSAEWNHEYDFKDKRVAVIGTGCSGIQVVPALVNGKCVKSLDVYQRQPGHILPKEHLEYSNLRQYLYYFMPFLLVLHRWKLYWFGELVFFKALLKESKMQKELLQFCDEYRDSKIDENNDDLRMKLKPNTPFGSKRVLIEQGYYECFNSKKAKLVTNAIQSMTEKGLKTEDGVETEYDCIVFCTGYITQECLRSIPNGVTNMDTKIELKRDLWKIHDFHAYIGKTVSGFPNWFHIMGPGTGLGHSSMILIIENDCNYIAQIVEKMIRMNGEIKSIEVKKEIMDEFNERMDKQMQKMVWTDESTKSWYKNSNGRVTALFGWNTVYYWWLSRKVHWNDFVLK